MSAGTHWMPLYVGDYQRDTGHLTTLEHGAYLLLLMQAWTRGGALPSDEKRLAALARCTPKQWAEVREAVMAFFTLDGDTYRNGRLDRELARAEAVSEERRRAGAVGAAKRWQRDGKPIANAMANAMATASQTGWQTDAQPQPQSQPEEKRVTPPTPRAGGSRPRKQNSDTPEFLKFWALYPRREGKGAARRAWQTALAATDGDHEQIIAGLKVAVSLGRFDMREGGRFCPHPATWLNGERWLDGIEPESPQQPVLRIVQ